MPKLVNSEHYLRDVTLVGLDTYDREEEYIGSYQRQKLVFMAKPILPVSSLRLP